MLFEEMMRKNYKEGLAEGRAEGLAEAIAKYLQQHPQAAEAAALFDIPVERIRQIAADNAIVLK